MHFKANDAPDPAALGGGPMLAAVLVAALLASIAFAAAAADLGNLIAPYLAAREQGAVGTVVGRAYAEASRAGDPPRPYAAVSVLLVPRTPGFEGELAAIKAARRDSPDRFVDADPQIRATRTAFERALIEAGAGALMKGDSTDGTGIFRFADVPEGAWMLLGWQESGGKKTASRSSKSDAIQFPTRPEVVASFTVVYWLLPLDVRAGEETQVRLHDRNTWLTAIREVRSGRDSEKLTAPGRP
jgi:hypothetical protein